MQLGGATVIKGVPNSKRKNGIGLWLGDRFGSWVGPKGTEPV